MILSRELGKRIWGGSSTNMENGGSGVSSDYIAGLLTGYAKESWVDEHYISIDFFSRLFQAHGTENGSEIDVMPNDMETTITSVESMFGFWTNLYISALGSNGAAPAGISLGMLTDVTISGTPSAGQVLTFDAVSGKWVNGNAQAGVTALANLTDVVLTSLADGEMLIFNGATSRWINTRMKTINGQSINGDGDISVGGGASGNFLPLTGGTMVGSIYFDSAGSYGPNGSLARIITTSDHYGGLVIQLGSGNGASGNYNRLEIINDAWNKAGLIVDNKCITRIGGQDISTLLDEKNALRVCAYNGNHFPLVTGAPTKGLVLGTDDDGEPCVGTYGSGFNYIRLGGRVKVDLGLEIFNTTDNTPYIDFHYNNSSADYTSRIIESTSGLLEFTGSAKVNNHLYVMDRIGINTTTPSYQLHVVGTIYATGAITALSDARKKDITGGVGVTVEQIAHAPAVQFLWKDKERRKDGQQVGTIAQYWQTVLPEVVMDKGGELSMQYGVAALVSAIVTARKVVDHGRRIAELEKEVEQLRLN